MNRLLNYTFAITAVIYLALLTFSPYTGQFAVKVIPILLLLAMVITSLSGRLKWLVSGAVIASGCGDVLLALPLENGFIYGLGAFLVAQLIYAITYCQHFQRENKKPAVIFLSILIAAFAIAMANYILPATGDLVIPVSCYLTVISLMAISAWLSNFSYVVGIGAVSFLISDTILALSIFKTPLPLSSFWVMSTYYLAQYLMVVGIIKTSQSSR